jgi:hypothetical protein
MKRWIYVPLVSLVSLAISPREPLLAKEARPPQWSRDVLDTFFDDAREALNGPRPDYGRKSGADQPPAAATPADTNEAFAWSTLIDAETLEAEIKRLNQSVASSVGKAGAFKSGGFKDARRDFSELAVLFAVTAQYDGNARWKDVAPGMRDEFAKAAVSAKVGTDDSLRQATTTNTGLTDLIRGDRPPKSAATANVTDWSQIAARPLLMQRLQISQQERLTKWLADPATFRRNQTEVAHEAQVLAMLAEVIQRAEYEFSDDDTYVGHADELRQAAGDLSTAAGSGNYEQAQSAIGRATKACADCHDGYRG